MESHFCTVSQIFLAIPIMNPLTRVHDNSVNFNEQLRIFCTFGKICINTLSSQ